MGALDRIGLGYQTQWKGLDPKGKPQGAIYSDWEAPKDQWQFNSEAQQYLPPQRTVRPGMVDDVMALPDVVTLGRGPKFSHDASERTQNLDIALRGEAGIGDPESWGDYLGEAAGVMAAQVPTPGGETGFASKFLGPLSKVLRRIPKPVRKVAGAIPEWFMPTIEPTAANYLSGTVGGAALTKYLPELAAHFGTNPDDIWDLATRAAEDYSKASPEDRQHMLSPDLLLQIAQHMDPQEEDQPAENFQGEDDFLDELIGGSGTIEEPNEEVPAMAKGGKVTGGGSRVKRLLLSLPAKSKVRALLEGSQESPALGEMAKLAEELHATAIREGRDIDEVATEYFKSGAGSEVSKETLEDRFQGDDYEAQLDEVARRLTGVDDEATRLAKVREAIETYSNPPNDETVSVANRNISQDLDSDEFGTVAEYLRSLGFPDASEQLAPHLDRIRELEQTGGPGYEEAVGDAYSMLREVLGSHPLLPQKKARGGIVKDYAKGGKVPPVHPKLKLRERIKDLMSDAQVEGTGKEMVPADPTSSLSQSVPSLEDLKASIEQPSPSETSFEGPKMTRRDVLHGMASLASPVKLDPMSLLRSGDESSQLNALRSTFDKLNEGARAAMPSGMSKAALAKALQGVYYEVVHSSDPSLEGAADLIEAVPDGEKIGALLREWDHKINQGSDFGEDWDTAMLTRQTKFENMLKDLAHDKGLIAHETWEDFGTEGPAPPVRTDLTFVEPPEGGQNILDEAIHDYENLVRTSDGRPEDHATLAELKKLRDHLGPRADAVFAQTWMDDGPHVLGEEIKKLDLDQSLEDILADAAESHYVGDSLDEWAAAPPELREEYRNLFAKTEGINHLEPTPEHQALLERLDQVKDTIYPSARDEEE